MLVYQRVIKSCHFSDRPNHFVYVLKVGKDCLTMDLRLLHPWLFPVGHHLSRKRPKTTDTPSLSIHVSNFLYRYRSKLQSKCKPKKHQDPFWWRNFANIPTSLIPGIPTDDPWSGVHHREACTASENNGLMASNPLVPSQAARPSRDFWPEMQMFDKPKGPKGKIGAVVIIRDTRGYYDYQQNNFNRLIQTQILNCTEVLPAGWL